jgi:transposase
MLYTDSLSGLGCAGCQALQRELQGLRAKHAQAQEQMAELRDQVAHNESLIAQQNRELDQLQERLDKSEREAHRQAAPFRRPERKRKETKGKPGRKAGHKGSYRPVPVANEEAEVPLERCPKCQGPVHHVRPIRQVIEDIPQIVLRRLQLTTYQGRCPQCGLVHSTHPDQVSTATGAAGSHLGKNALALAAYLNKGLGLTMRRTCDLLEQAFGLSITPGGLNHALKRIADKVLEPYKGLLQSLNDSPVVHADETGWWVGGQSAWLWVFTNPQLTVYAIGDRSNAMRQSILPDDYKGVLVTDCLGIYDLFPGRKSKCCAHHLKAISEALEQAPDSTFLHDTRVFFEAAIFWHSMRGEVAADEYEFTVAHLHGRIDELLAPLRSHPAEIKIRNRLLKQRPHLLTFLAVPGVDPTNNLAERQLRPAVIARKLSCGNKTPKGQLTFEILASIAATCRQNQRDFTEFIAAHIPINGPRPPPLLGPCPNPSAAKD